IDLALLDCAVATQANVAQAYLTSGTVPPRQGNAHLQIVPYEAFQTADEWLILAVGNDAQSQRLCQVVHRPHLSADARFTTNALRVEHRRDLTPQLEQVFRTRPAAEWRHLLDAAKIPHAPVWDYAQVFASDQAQARGLRVTVRDPRGQPVHLVGSPLHI